jgi:uncharacterized damage-inducible protein DinB
VEPTKQPAEQIVTLSDKRRVLVTAWAVMPTRNHVLAIKEFLASLGRSGLDSIDFSAQGLEAFQNLDLGAILSDENVKRACQMISDATLARRPLADTMDSGTDSLSPDEVANLNQYDFEALARAVWDINIRPRMALLDRKTK